ncbi:MAG: hypothetical protein E5299_01575 [Burkholderia gladioli]|nr:MAG: hypothetical protein E5299_01575 [Burkholderia gladioli]
MASTGILITNFGSIISGDMHGLRTSEVRNPFHCVFTLDLCNNAASQTEWAHPFTNPGSGSWLIPPNEL